MSMTADRTDGSRLRRVLDGVTYAVVVTVAVSLIAFLVSLPFGDGLSTVKVVLFFFGWGAFGYGTLKLWPRRKEFEKQRAARAGDGSVSEQFRTSGEETPFQRRLHTAPGLNRITLPPEARWSDGARVFLLGIVALLASFVLETAFGV